MPEAGVVFGMDFSRVRSSPTGQLLRQGMQAGMKSGGGADLQKLLATTGFDPFQDIQEILVATTGTGKNPPTLFVARLASNGLQALMQSRSGPPATSWHGARIMPGKSPTAFVDDLFLAGDLALIKAAILRRGQRPALDSALVRRISIMRDRYDLWLISLTSLSSLTSNLPASNTSQSFGNLDALKAIDQFCIGIGMSSDFILDVEMTARDAKSAGSLADSIRLLLAMAQQGQANNPSAAAALKNLQLAVDDKVIRIGIQVPADEVQKQMQQALTSWQTAGAGAAAQPGQRPPARPAERSRVPPNAAVMIQSSPKDMGTVVITSPKK